MNEEIMKILAGLNKRLEHFDPDASTEQKEKLPTYRQMLMSHLATMVSPGGAVALVIKRVVDKVRAAYTEPEGQAHLEIDEFEALKAALENNHLGWAAYYHAQVVQKIIDAKEITK